MNGEYIKKMDPEEFYEKALPYMKEVLKRDYDFRKLPECTDQNRDIPGYPGTDRFL